MRGASLFFVLLCAFACAGPPESNADRAHAIEAQVWSPYCPGRLLIDCTTNQARELRVQIQQRVDRGQRSDRIFAWVRSEFGDEALARPEAKGRGLVVWLVPAAIFLGGAIAVARTVRRWRAAAAEA
jgi:cytochrome c-type biogenesis protein CcmH/NrfF